MEGLNGSIACSAGAVGHLHWRSRRSSTRAPLLLPTVCGQGCVAMTGVPTAPSEKAARGKGPQKRRSDFQRPAHVRKTRGDCSGPKPSSALSNEEMLHEKLDHLDGGRDAILLLSEPVTFVRKEDVLDRDVAALQVRDDLLRLDDGNIGVVGAMLHHQRRLDAIELSQR